MEFWKLVVVIVVLAWVNAFVGGVVLVYADKLAGTELEDMPEPVFGALGCFIQLQLWPLVLASVWLNRRRSHDV